MRAALFLAALALALVAWALLVVLLNAAAPTEDVRDLARDISPCTARTQLPPPFAVTVDDFHP